MARLVEYDWPGNIRELRNLIERLHILHEGHEVHAGDLPEEFHRAPAAAALPPGRPAPAGDDVLRPLAEVEWRHIERVLSATAWNKARAARVLEVDIKTLNKKIRDFKIPQPRWPGSMRTGACSQRPTQGAWSTRTSAPRIPGSLSRSVCDPASSHAIESHTRTVRAGGAVSPSLTTSKW